MLHLGVRAVSVRGGAVVTDAGVVSARCVVVAGDAAAASEPTGLPSVPTHALTTFYHLAEQSPAGRLGRLLHLDGDRRGPVVNTAVVSDVAPTYAAGRGALVSSTVLGDRDEPATEQVVRAQAAAGVRRRPAWLAARAHGAGAERAAGHATPARHPAGGRPR
ncbi:hypothetical protein GCM10025868_42590 [Angustibacter aerolatus]|uniref:FAD/NAD(P)-binding domain-containing protein n=1 Tax=Angustibacter aerolatus TaxID=1162965 RepID=A0ABQ6JM81_9ACTN|nr:hypothetical protein GCM10025868_42590 [Angustibacter aerolatus]